MGYLELLENDFTAVASPCNKKSCELSRSCLGSVWRNSSFILNNKVTKILLWKFKFKALCFTETDVFLKEMCDGIFPFTASCLMMTILNFI